MKRIALLTAAALIGAGSLASSAAEARGGGALAAGLIGGLAAGALIGAATQAHAAPDYGYGYGYGYGGRAYGYAPAYRPDAYDHVEYEPRRVVIEERVPVRYRPVRRWDDGCDRAFGGRGW